jgi:hypothetical protein
MDSVANASFFIDPWSLYAANTMRVLPHNDSYSASISNSSPDIQFKHFKWEPNEDRSFRDNIHFFASYVRDSGEIWARKEYHEIEPVIDYPSLGKAGFIRLLTLYPGKNNDQLRGELGVVKLKDTRSKFSKKKFFALSYVWGNGLKPFTIDLGATGPLRITTSLYFALKHIRDCSDGDTCLWVDAICINQEDQQEKGYQVSMMAEIFKSACYVWAWLGNEDDNSKFAINSLRNISSNEESKLPEADDTMWYTIDKFFRRDWFRRVWIVQEVILPPTVLIVCGKDSCDWEVIYKAAFLCSRDAEKSNAALMKSLSKTVAPVISLGRLRNEYHAKKDAAHRGLLTLFEEFEHTESTRKRDKLFAFLGLANDAQGFKPDYDSKLEKVVTEYARVFIQHGKGMELLYHAGRSGDNQFPSWVPNWVTTTYPKTITTWESRFGRFTAGSCMGNGNDPEPLREENSILSATGYILDSIREVGAISFSTSARIAYLKELFRFIETEAQEDRYGEGVADAVWKIPIGDAGRPPSGTWEKNDFRASYHALRDYIQLGEDTTDWNVEMNGIRAVARMRQFLFRPQELRKQLWHYLFTATEFAERFVDAKVCVTTKGYIGIVPGRAEKGALIAVLQSGAVPFVIEKIKGSHQLIGECYIHGVMHRDPEVLEREEVQIFFS